MQKSSCTWMLGLLTVLTTGCISHDHKAEDQAKAAIQIFLVDLVTDTLTNEALYTKYFPASKPQAERQFYIDSILPTQRARMSDLLPKNRTG